ncbi:hypothetical protein NKJ46_23810 [Mesorhizobium sp. M0166]|uniref:hypothetical protein n=1 Tax=unclassified Mesorhizobium TaxID=325217 RepID=UPI00333AB5E5
MKQAAALLALFLAGASVASAEPQLAAFVTDQNKDVYVALFDGKAVELAGCASPGQAKRLLHLPDTATVSQTTLAKLQAESGFGAQPRLPCLGTAFDIDWPATTAIWADVAASGNYYLPSPSGSGYFAVPTACAEIKAALAIRERLQLPGVLQGFVAPPSVGTPFVLDCGRGDLGGPLDLALPSAARWSLHRFETFLSADSIGDTVYVVRYTPPGEGVQPSYLPIVRLDGRATRDIIVDAAAAEAVEKKLRAFFGIAEAEGVTLLGADAVAALRSAPFVDLCLSNCEGYQREHAAFAQPGIDLGLSPLPAGPSISSLDSLGNARLDWTFADGRSLSFTGCPLLTSALGLSAPGIGDWMGETDRALTSAPAPATGFDCRGSASDTCIRRINDGGTLTLTQFSAEGDCAGRINLRLELPAAVQVPQSLILKGLPFKTVHMAPAPGITRTRLVGTANRVPGGTSSCILSATGVIIVADGLPRLELERIDLARAADQTTDEVVAVIAQNGTVALDNVTIGTVADGLSPVARGVSLCLADLYARGLRVEADMLAIQGVRARLLISAQTPARSSIVRARFGAVLTSDSLMRVESTDVSAANPLVLRGAIVAGRSVGFAPAATGLAVGSAIQLERGSSANFTTSTVSGFRCAVSFADSGSSASFLLPGNDIARDNTSRACGPGRFTLVE